MPVFMCIDGVIGSIGGSHTKWAMLASFNWGGTRGFTRNLQGPKRTGAQLLAPQLRAVKVTRVADHLSPEIWNTMLTTKKREVGFLWLRTGGKEPIPYLKLSLHDALITGMGEASSFAEPDETITISFDSLTLNVVNVGNNLSGPQDVVRYSLPKALKS